MIQTTIDQLFLSNMGFAVLLKGVKDERFLSIFIGAAEAQSMALSINKVEVPRPLTHDLLKNLLDYLECRLMRIEVCDLKEGTFYAKLVLERGGMEMKIDCRPSDAIALALRADAPIYVDEKVMDEAGRVHTDSGMAGTSAGSAERKEKRQRKALTPLEALQRDLKEAVKEERYEDAAQLRDKIKHLESTHSEN